MVCKGFCQQEKYRTIPLTGRNSSLIESIEKYRKCRRCEVSILWTESYQCPCCHGRLSTNPKKKSEKDKARIG